MEMPDKYSELASLGLKIIAIVGAIVSFRWIVKIFAGNDGKFSVIEFGKMAGIIFFLWAAVYIIIKEANRPSEYHLFSEWHLAIIFGGLLSVLHLESALDRIIYLMRAILDLKTKKVTNDQQ